MSEPHDSELHDWRKDGRCSACEHFRSDFGDPPDVYGHCKIYPRNGSREARDYACGEYRALPGHAALTQSTAPSRSGLHANGASIGIPSGIPSGGHGAPNRRPARPGPATPPHASVVRRRRAGDDDDDDDDDEVIAPARAPARPAPSPGYSAPSAAISGPGPSGPREGGAHEVYPSAPRPSLSAAGSQVSPVSGGRVVTESESTSQIARTLLGGGTGNAHSGGSLDRETLGAILVDLVENFIGLEEVEIGRKWEDGNLILQPGEDDLKEVTLPIKTFFHKIVMVRDRLRVLEQKINAHAVLTESEKIDLQQYISRCYGSLTTFNVLFKNKDDRFTSKGDE